MNKSKKICLTFIASNQPYTLTIYSQKGCVFQSIINKPMSKFCLCSCSKVLLVVARYANAIITKRIFLMDFCSNDFAISFNFLQPIIPSIVNIQTFSLYDANYNFPISQAILNFNKNEQ